MKRKRVPLADKRRMSRSDSILLIDCIGQWITDNGPIPNDSELRDKVVEQIVTRACERDNKIN
jgi:hypothetical protein